MRTISLALLFILLVASCSDEDVTLFSPSDEFISSNVRFQVIDTMSFNMSTYKLDSLPTDQYNKILVGKYNDPVFGELKCSGFINFSLTDYNFEDDAVFDSITLNLGYSGYFYNDTLLPKKIKIYELNKKLDYRNGQENFYNVDNFETTNLVGERTFFPRIARDSIKTTLEFTFGQNIFNKIRDGVINSDEELGEHFKGFKISPDDSENSSVIGFNVSNCYLRFYYSIPDEPDEAKFYDIKYEDFTTNRNHFTQVLCNRTGTLLPVDFVNQENEISSQNTNNLTFIQAGEGIVTKIAFPNFKEGIRNLNLSGSIYKARLKIPLSSSFYSKKLYTSDSLRVFIVDQNNTIVSETQKAYVKLDDPEFNIKYLELPVESFLEKVLNFNSYRNYGLMLLPHDYGASTTRLVLNDNKNGDKKAKLNLTYLSYDN